MQRKLLFSLMTTMFAYAPFALGDVIINEVDADQTSTDTAEFIELYDGGVGNTSLDGMVVVLFNGSDDASYLAFDLDTYTTGVDGYFVLCNDAANVGNCDYDAGVADNMIQNGADAVALYTGDAVDFPNDTPITTTNLLDAIVYGTSDSDDAGLLPLLNAGQPQVDENGAGNKDLHSSQRTPNGSGGVRNTDTYAQEMPTPGTENAAPQPGPIVTGTNHLPVVPSSTDAVTVSTDVVDGDGGSITSVDLYYTVDAGAEQGPLSMGIVLSTYAASIPAQADGASVSYRIAAEDNDMNTADDGPYGYTVSNSVTVTIADIQGVGDTTPYSGQQVTFTGQVTGVLYNGFFLQDAAAARSGIQVYTGSTPTVVLNDRVEITGTAGEYATTGGTNTQITSAAITFIENVAALYAPILVTGDLAMTEDYEDVLIRVEDGTCTVEANGFGNSILNDGIADYTCDDSFYAFAPALGTCYHVQGVQYYSYGFTLNPRDTDDYSLCSPADEAPVIVSVTQNPLGNPGTGEAVSIDAEITDDNMIGFVNLVYTVDGGAAVTVAMFAPVLDLYDGAIPAQTDGAFVEYHVEATDNLPQTTVGDTYSYTQAAVVVEAPAVFISEYIEGSVGNNKALEIYNGDDVAVDLNDLALWRISNAGSWYEYLFLFSDYSTEFDMTLDPGEVFAICNGGSDVEISSVSDMVGTALCYHNGNDALGVAYRSISGADTTWTLIDAIGEESASTPSNWDVAGVVGAGADHTLIRKTSVTQGNTNWTSSAGTDEFDSEWIVLDDGTFNYLGSHPDVIIVDNAPVITGLAHLPAAPEAIDVVTVSADVTDDNALVSVTLYYAVDGGAETSVAMTNVGDTYSGDIPAQADQSDVTYRVVAEDDATQISESNGSYHIGSIAITPIYDIQFTTDPSGISPLLDQTVTVRGFVTAIGGSGSGSFFIQDAATAWSGVQVYGSNAGVAIGDDVTATGTVLEYYEHTEVDMGGTPSYTVNSSGNPAYTVPLLDVATGLAEAWESMIIRIEGVTCDTAMDGNGVWYFHDASASGGGDDWMYDAYVPAIGTCYDLQGVNYYSYDEFKINPRDASEVGICGGGNAPPAVQFVSHTPSLPITSTDVVTVTADVSDPDGTVSMVEIHYTVDGGIEQTVAMSVTVEPAYTGDIPAQSDGAAIVYWVVGTDDMSDTGSSSDRSYWVRDTFICDDIDNSIRINDAEGLPTTMYQPVQVCGVVTVANELGTSGPLFITGPTGSIALFGGAAAAAGLVIGDDVEIIGEVNVNNGLIQIQNSLAPVVLSQGNALTPVPATIAGLLADAENLEGQLVTLSGVTLLDPASWPPAGDWVNMEVQVGADVLTLRIDADTDIDGSAAPGTNEINVTGVFSQYDTSSPYFGGYQIIPRMRSDITDYSASLEAPVVSVDIAGALVNISWEAVAGATDYIIYESTDAYTNFTVAVASTGDVTSYGFFMPAQNTFYRVVAVQ
jgi:hypothetical protein